jgi:hypothetical protein
MLESTRGYGSLEAILRGDEPMPISRQPSTQPDEYDDVPISAAKMHVRKIKRAVPLNEHPATTHMHSEFQS